MVEVYGESEGVHPKDEINGSHGARAVSLYSGRICVASNFESPLAQLTPVAPQANLHVPPRTQEWSPEVVGSRDLLRQNTT